MNSKSAFSLVLSIFVASLLLAPNADAAAKKKSKPSKPTAPSPWAEWVEPDYPFFSSILDAGNAGALSPTNNLTPRGVMMNLGHNLWACFDTDLLRISAIWQGEKGQPPVTPNALAPKSYHLSGGKTPGGQNPAPEPIGKLWLASGIYPGWQVLKSASDKPDLTDPREPAPTVEEVGRGPLPDAMNSRLRAVRIRSYRHQDKLFTRHQSVDFTVGGTFVTATFGSSAASAGNNTSPDRQANMCDVAVDFEVQPHATPLACVLGKIADAVTLTSIVQKQGNPKAVTIETMDGVRYVKVQPADKPVSFTLHFRQTSDQPIPAGSPYRADKEAPFWPQEVTTNVKLSTAKDAYVVDHVELPFKNPWRRNLRPSDIQFLKDGTGVVVTLDGDVWLARGLNDASGKVRWKRFASGLHEPMSCAIRDNEIYVFDRNGIWRLRDTNGDGEADVHELFSNAFAQTADMREFPSQVRLAPSGEFIIAKGGQQATTLGKHNGSVLRVSADGRHSTVLGYGFRQPNIGVNIRTGLVTSSDQEGQYIPSTPLHIVRDQQFYGYLSNELQPREKYPAPIADPLTWVPHAVNASAISQVWLFDAKLGALNDSLVHIGFNKPELFRVLMNNRTAKPQAAVVSVTRAFEFPPLNGSVNPVDGQLYIAGFQVIGWGNSLDTLAGLGRVRYTGAPVTLPREIVPMDKGVLMRFDVALDAKQATDPDSYSLATWHYQRTYKYGSPQLKADGKPGLDWLTASSAYLSKDGRSVFIGVPEMKPVMQLRIGWSLATTNGLKFEENGYTTPYELATFDPKAEGFGDITVDLTPRAAAARASGPVTVEEGRRLYQLLGCVACHSADGVDVAKVGPTWTGLFGKEREVFADKKKISTTANEDYIRESILDPPAKIVSGFERGEYAMPSYAGVANDSQIEALILFIKSLKDVKPAAVKKSADGAPAKSPYE